MAIRSFAPNGFGLEMATLGEIVAQLDGGTDIDRLLARLENPALITKLESHAAAAGRQPAECAVDAVRAFSDGADDDAWLKLLGRLQDAPSPAAACLKEMLTWALKV